MSQDSPPEIPPPSPVPPEEDGAAQAAPETAPETAAESSAAPGAETIVIGLTHVKERQRRRRELILALTCFALIGVLTYIQLRFMGINSYLFLGLFNVNFILLLLVLFIVARNGVKLLLERRRKVLGSRLRTRLVLAFVSLSLIPTVLMFMVSVKFVQTSVDYWFKVQVEDSMEQALGLGQSFYRAAQTHLNQQASHMERFIREQQYAWGGKAMDAYLEQKFAELDLHLVAVVNPDGTIQNQHMSQDLESDWPEIADRVRSGHQSSPESPILLPMAKSDLIIVLTPVDEGKTGHLLLGQTIGQGVHYKLRQVINGLTEYKNLRNLKNPWKMTLYLTLGVMTLLIILGAIWFGFRLAKELSEPIQALAAGTERVARGDLDVRLEDRSDDEMGSLVQSFNRMTADLRESQERLHAAYERLSDQNIQLEQHGRYIEAVLDNITSGVITLDNQARISTVNKAAQTMLGAVPDFIVGRRPTELVRGQFADLMEEALVQMSDNPSSQWQRQVDVNVRGRDQKFLVNVVALRDDSGGVAGTVAVFEDITEIEKMQRMAAWREVARRIAHEIKNPLTPIKLSAQRLQRRFGSLTDDEAFGECTGLIVKQVERLQQMVTQFSAYAKLPEVTPRPDFLAPLLEEVTAMFENTYRDIEWTLTFETTIPEIPFDHEAIRRVLINLLTNAAEALEGRTDGRVEIVAGHLPQAGWVTLAICDNGPGFGKNEASRMFEPYFSSKKTGTGLGLTIVRSIINDHRGSVTANTTGEQGTVFTINLPEK